VFNKNVPLDFFKYRYVSC